MYRQSLSGDADLVYPSTNFRRIPIPLQSDSAPKMQKLDKSRNRLWIIGGNDYLPAGNLDKSLVLLPICMPIRNRRPFAHKKVSPDTTEGHTLSHTVRHPDIEKQKCALPLMNQVKTHFPKWWAILDSNQ